LRASGGWARSAGGGVRTDRFKGCAATVVASRRALLSCDVDLWDDDGVADTEVRGLTSVEVGWVGATGTGR